MGDHVFLKVMPKRGVIKFGKQGKLSLRYIGPLEVLERVGIVAYQLTLPSSLSSVHDIFHVSMLRKYTPDPTHVVDWVSLLLIQMRPSRRDQCVSWKSRPGFATQDCKASEGAMEASRSGGGNLRA